MAGWLLRAIAGFLALLLILPACRAADELLIVTEELPPYNFTDQGSLTGLSTEVVQAVLHQLDLTARFKVMPWARAYELAQSAPNVLIYSITRTRQREPRFKWVGSVAPEDIYLFSSAQHPVVVHRLQEASRYTVATVYEDVGDQYLRSLGFTVGKNLQPSAAYQLNYQKLKAGRVDLWVMNLLVAQYLARREGDDPQQVLYPSLHLTEISGDYYMAFSPQTPDALVERFRKGLLAIKQNGTFDRIKAKWLM
ncbi:MULTISPECIES: ABC transporter substrate-binding protein [unclassified Paludibacterium]|uniref:substrate-binding periplasmic protein n=1 Tax=unclassified Paludibacterium TaxID=2618429 RepID=UPI001C05B3FB|nr:transporter substrate-binding domain-containing protein [Paludibacterium sp. B53371]BEV73544.1 transporter substrate-binding domain-containing protein [Paludibacterium sp. THUN1379]